MHHTNKRLPSAARWIAGAAAVLFPLASFALGLGKLTVRSALNEPLNAEVEIISISEKELKGLQVGLAPRGDFERAGVERLAFLNQIKFTVSKRGDGTYFVQLNTDQQIEEPFLHMLLAVEWPGGRVVREYTALIDPPVQTTGRPGGIEAPTTGPSTTPPVVSAPAPAAAPTQESSKPEVVAKEEVKPVPAPSAPTAEQQQPAAVPASPTEEPKPTETATAPEATRAPEPLPPPSNASSAKPTVASGWAMEGGYKVKWGDTAWRIAEQLRTDDRQSVEQVVLALYRANPHAFFGSNINNLKSGQILKLPENTEVDSVTPVQARTQFRAQYDAWQEYKIKLASAASAVKVESEPPKPVVAAPVEKVEKPEPVKKAEAPKPEPAPAPKEDPIKKAQEKAAAEKVAKAPTPTEKPAMQQDELLKIVRSTLQGDKATAGKKSAEGEAAKDVGAQERQALADRVATLEESLASKQVETKEMGDKLAQVRAQLKRESRLIQIEQKDLANQQARVTPETVKPEPMPKPEVKTPPKPEPAPQPEVVKPEPPKPVEQPKVETPKPAETPAPVPTAEAPKIDKPAAEKRTPPKAATPPPAPAEEKGFVTEFIDSLLGGDMLMLGIVGGAILLSAGIVLTYISRRRKSIAEFEESILQSDAITTATSESPAAGGGEATSQQASASGDTSFLSDFSQTGMGNIHTDEVDPVAEAEVYLAYGRDETAEEILKEAIVKNPAREESKVKLLEIYANRGDVRAFETLAEEMYASMGGKPNKNWAKVEELGRKISPNNPMFRGGGAGMPAGPATATAPAPSFADTAKMQAAPAASSVSMDMGDESVSVMRPSSMSASTPASSPTEITDFDFDLSTALSAPAPSPAPPASSSTSMEVDFSSVIVKPTTKPESSVEFSVSGVGAPAVSTDISMDIGQPGDSSVEFDFDKGSSEIVAPGSAAHAAEGGESPQWDETATKLDLARAYIDMGDSEGAKSILEEVMAEGNEQQKKQAKELAAQIA